MTPARSIPVGGPAASRPERLLPLPALAAGLLTGVACVVAGGLDLRWLVYGAGFIVAGLVVSLSSRKERLLLAATVLALQADVDLRLFVGHAGSGGLAFPLALFPAVGLLFWWRTGSPARPRLRVAGRLGLPIAALFATTVASIAVSHERFVGITELLLEVELYLVYVVILNAVRSEADVEWITKLLCACVVVQAVAVALQSALGVSFSLTGDLTANDDSLPFAGGTVGRNPAHLVAFILPPVLIAVAPLLTERVPRARLAVVAALGIATLVLTLKRAAWVGFAIATAWLVALARAQHALRLGRVVCVGAVVAVLGAGAWGMMAVRLERFPVSDAYAERVGLMQMAVDAIETHPVFGVGAGAYGQTFKQFLTRETSHQWLWIVHNEYLLRGAETGVPGLIAFLAVLTGAFRQALRLSRSPSPTLRTFGRGWSAALVALAWHMWWEPWQSFPEVSMFWLLLGVAEASEGLGA